MPNKGVPTPFAKGGKPKIQPSSKSLDMGRAENAISKPKKHSKNKV